MLKPLPPPWDRFVPFLQKLSVWAGFFTILWFLRPFFFLVFLTFVFGYVLEHIVETLEPRIDSRRTRVIVGFVTILAILVGMGFVVAPELAKQADAFPKEIKRHIVAVDEALEKLRQDYPSIGDLMPQNVSTRDIAFELFGFHAGDTPHPATPVPPPPQETGSPSVLVDDDSSIALRSWLPQAVKILGSTVAIGSAFLLSLLFSLLIVLDLPNLAVGAKHLRETRLRFIYDEVSDNVFHFGRVLGRALEAQLMIAILNTALTAIGLYFMEIPNIAFLSAIVFVCSFIPVAGVFVSSLPICLQTLTAKADVVWVLYMIGFITIIHMIEAYILNPRIYGAHLKMNPVLVLSILVISHHLFGVWGLVLGVPITTYVYKYVICGRRDAIGDDDDGPQVPVVAVTPTKPGAT
jgi:predicted PurR-regulated permease PerM